MCCFVILLLSNEMQMSVRRFSAIPHLRAVWWLENSEVFYKNLIVSWSIIVLFRPLKVSGWEIKVSKLHRYSLVASALEYTTVDRCHRSVVWVMELHRTQPNFIKRLGLIAFDCRTNQICVKVRLRSISKRNCMKPWFNQSFDSVCFSNVLLLTYLF